MNAKTQFFSNQFLHKLLSFVHLTSWSLRSRLLDDTEAYGGARMVLHSLYSHNSFLTTMKYLFTAQQHNQILDYMK